MEIQIKGILEGIRNMLKTDTESPDLLKTRMECSRSMLEGVIKELTPPKVEGYSVEALKVGGILDPTAQQAKKELL